MNAGARANTGVAVPRPLIELAAALEHADLSEAPTSPRIEAVCTHSKRARPGSLFVAIRGIRIDGHDFIPEVVRRGAAAVVVERSFRGEVGVPVVRVENTRRAAADLAAAWYGYPARRLRLVGITGSFGKTTVLSTLEAILSRAGAKAGAVGSLGVHIDREKRGDPGQTVPDPLLLHQDLARIVGEGCELAAMEVTSHALVQERVHGLNFDLGVFTNLVPLEHSEFHPTFRDYVDAKRLFFAQLRPCAPLVFNLDDRVVRRLAHDSGADLVGCGASLAARVRVRLRHMHVDGSRFLLTVRHPLPRLDGGESATGAFPLQLRLLGCSNVANATLAATTALCLGVDPPAIRDGIAALPQQPRRLQVIHDRRFLVLDDIVGHPDSISFLFQVVKRFRARAVHVAFAVRGRRGVPVNESTAETLAIWTRQVPLRTLVVTSSVEAADELNRVDDAELEAVLARLREHRIAFSQRDRLDHAVHDVLERAEDGDLVLLLGAQGMDRGPEIAHAWLRERSLA